MNTTPPSASTPVSKYGLVSSLGWAAVVLLFSLPAKATPTTYYWNAVSTTNQWTDGASWSDDPDSAGTTGVVPLDTDNVVFNQSTINGATTPLLSANTQIGGITFNNTGTTTITGSGANRYLTVGGDGVTLGAGAGVVTFGTSSANKNIFVLIGADQTWTNNSTNGVNARNHIEGPATGTTGVTLTVNAASSGTIGTSGALQDGAGGAPVALVVASTGTGTSNFNGTYSGGTTIKSGKLSIGSGTIGASTGDVVIGDSSGGYDAQLLVTGSQTIGNKFTIQSGNTGTMSIGFASGTTAPTPTLTGSLILNKDLLLGSNSTNNTAPIITLSGDISGVGGLTVNRVNTGSRDASLVLSGTNTYQGDTLIVKSGSTFTLDTGGTMTFYIGANGVNNSISGGGGIANFDGTFDFDLSGASLVDGNSWTIVDVGTFAESFSGTFSVGGFAGNPTSGVWTNGGFTFTQSDGLLTYMTPTVPEPSTCALVGGAAVLLLAVRRRRSRPIS